MINLNSKKKEFLDIIDKNDIVIDLKSRDDIHCLGLRHREVHVWLFDKNQNIYFQKSSARKSSAGLFDASIGAHVDKGENYLTAAVRETKEESGMVIKAEDLIFLKKVSGISKYKYLNKINNFIRSIYIYKYPVSKEQLKHDEDETDGFYKFSIDFLSNMNDKEKAKFHKFVPTNELPYILNYLKNLQ